MRIGLTGERGLIGQAVAKGLVGAGHEIVGLGAWTYGWDPDQTREIASDAPRDLDWTLHLGARTSIAESWENPFATYSNNLGSTLAAFEITRRSNASFLFMSSYVYGVPRYIPLDEAHPTSAVNPYMGSKLLGEELCRQWHDLYKNPLIVLRAFNIYGNSTQAGRLIPDLIGQVKRGEGLEVLDPEPIRDYLHVDDFAELVRKIVAADPVPSGEYNVGSGQSYSNVEVAEMIRELTKDPRPVKMGGHRRPNDILNCTVDASKVQKTFDWKPQYTLERGLADLLCDHIET